MDIGFKFALTLFFVAMNGFFVAAEFAIIRVRQTRIAELAAQGSTSATTVKAFLVKLDTYLSATQLGVTLASLALGSIGTDAMTHALRTMFSIIGIPVSNKILWPVEGVVGLLIISALHIIFGELIPKWWVIAHTENTALAVAGPMKVVLTVCYPLIKILEKSASLVAKFLKIEPSKAHGQAHSEDEILAIMAHSHREGELRPSEIEIAENVFDFAHTQAREIMVPRVDMVYLSNTWSIGRNVEVAVENGFTRYPLCEGDRDHVIGMVHIKDLLSVAGDPNADIVTCMRPIIGIPETKPIDELLKELQKSHTHQAVVIDEYGGTAGLVTLEDILEELVGEIQDEHDRPASVLRLDEAGDIYSVATTVSLEEVTDTLKLPITNPDEYETIGGYVLHQLKLPPRHGASVELDGYRVTASEVVGRRIRRLVFERIPAAAIGDGEIPQ